MYYTKDPDQISLDELFLSFGGHLRKDNRWVRLAAIMPWEHVEEIYLKHMSQETGRRAYSSRIAFGSNFIKETENLTDEGTVAAIQENPYMQYFLGLREFHEEPLFDPSMMVHFRKRFPVGEVAKINEYICTGIWPEEFREVDRNDCAAEQDDEDEHQPPATGTTSGVRHTPCIFNIASGMYRFCPILFSLLVFYLWATLPGWWTDQICPEGNTDESDQCTARCLTDS